MITTEGLGEVLPKIELGSMQGQNGGEIDKNTLIKISRNDVRLRDDNDCDVLPPFWKSKPKRRKC